MPANDFVKPLKLEAPPGSDFDEYPTEADPSEDVVLAAGLAIETSGTLIDKDVSGNMRFNDTPAGAHTLKSLSDGSILAVCSRYTILLTHNGLPSNGDWLGYSSLIPGDDTPIIFPLDCTLLELTFSNKNSDADFDLELYKNGLTVTEKFHTINKTNILTFTETGIDEHFNANDKFYIKFIDQGKNPSDVAIILFLQNDGI